MYLLSRNFYYGSAGTRQHKTILFIEFINQENHIMKMQEIRQIAKSFEIKIPRATKAQLILAIQQAEGNNACFATDANLSCGQLECLWRDDCITPPKKKK